MYIATPILATSTGKWVSQRPTRTNRLGRLSRALWITKLSARMVWSGSIVEVAPIGAPHSWQNVANLLFGVRHETQVIVSSLLVISFLLATVCHQHFTKVAMIVAKPVSTTCGSGWVRSCAATELLNTGLKATHPPATAGGTDCVQQQSLLLRQGHFATI